MVTSNPQFENGQDIRDRAFALSCRVVTLCEDLYARGGVARVLAPQLVASSTSVPANLEEAQGAESRRDFVSKCSIALKEARETHVRLRVCLKTRKGNIEELQKLVAESDAIVRIVATIVRNTRRNARLPPFQSTK